MPRRRAGRRLRPRPLPLPAGAAAGGGGGGAGGAVSTGDLEGNFKRVLITETEENLNRIENLLRAIDRPPRQVFLDVKVISITQGLINQFGNQFRAILMKSGRNE